MKNQIAWKSFFPSVFLLLPAVLLLSAASQAAQYPGWTVFDTSNSGLPSNRVNSIVIDAGGNEWIGTLGGGLAKFDGTNWTVYNTSNSGLPGNGVWSIAIDAGGNKWIGTLGGGLVKFDGTNWTMYSTSNSGLPNNRVYSIAIDATGNKWVGTGTDDVINDIGGCAKFDGTNWTVYNSLNSGLRGNQVNSIAIDANGIKWIGTGSLDAVDYPGGFVKFDDAGWTVYTTSNSGLRSKTVYSVAIDSNGNKWMGSAYDGIAVFSDNTAARKDHIPSQNSLVPLCRNYPNPFKQKAFISYNVLENGSVCLRVRSLDGQSVRTLVKTRQTIGSYTVAWDGRSDTGKLMARGVYMYQLTCNGRTMSRKMNFVE